jgi:hypothetical protein
MSLPTFEEQQPDSLLAEDNALEPKEPIVGWVVWKDEWDEMIVLSDKDGQPRLFSSHEGAKARQGALDVVVPVTQRRYDELCRKKAAVVEEHQPPEDDADEDPQKLYVKSILAKIDERFPMPAKKVVEPDSTVLKQAARLDVALFEQAKEARPALNEQVLEPKVKPQKQAVKRQSSPGGARGVRGWIYLFKVPRVPGLYKIGKSNDPDERLREVQLMSPVDVTIECVKPTDDMTVVEGLLHSVFAQQRRHGEWFWLSEEEAEWVKKLDLSRALVLFHTPWKEWPTCP